MASALEGGEWSAARPGRTLSPGKTRYPLYRRLGGHQGRSGQMRKISPPPGFDRWTFQPVVSRYTDWATRPTRSVYREAISTWEVIWDVIEILLNFYAHLSEHRESIFKHYNMYILLFYRILKTRTVTTGIYSMLICTSTVCQYHNFIRYSMSLPAALTTVYSSSWWWVNVSPETCGAVYRE
jgi:hypothetical protein